MARILSGLLLAIIAAPATAVTVHTTLLDLLNHIGTDDVTVHEDFEGFTAGTGLHENTPAGGINVAADSIEPLIVANAYSTTSGVLSLGLDNPDWALKANDRVTFTFATPVTGFGLYVITEESLQEGDFMLSSKAGTAANSDTAETLLPDGRGYFIGLVLSPSDDSINTVELAASDDFDFNYNLDDILVVRKDSVSSSSSGGASSGSSSSSSSSGGSSSSGNPSDNRSSSGGGALGWTGLLLVFGTILFYRLSPGVNQ